MRILLLANSKKMGDRCLAGLDDHGNWVRPVTSAEGGAIPRSVAMDIAQPLRPMDIVEFDSIGAVPLPHQGENVLVDPTTIRRVGVGDPDDARLRAAAAVKPWFLRDWMPSVPAATYASSTGAQSLALLTVPDFRAVRRIDQFGVHWRGSFLLGDAYADFPLTDDLYTSALSGSTERAPATLCISVGERFDRDDSHYKLIAGVFAPPKASH